MNLKQNIPLFGFLGLMLISLNGCGKNEDAILDEYLNSLDNTLGTEKVTYTNIQPLSFKKIPNKKSMVLTKRTETDESNINILEFLKLKECRLQLVIAEKNNNLGKVAPVSQRLLNDIQFITYAPICLEALEKQQQLALAEKVRKSLSLKRLNLNETLWQAIFSENEYRQFWSPANNVNKALNQYPFQFPPKVDTALIELHAFIGSVQEKTIFSPNNIKNINLEQHLGVLNKGDGGQLLKSYITLHNQLLLANQKIQTAIDKPFCYAGHRNPRAEIFQSVINLIFIQQVQAYANALDRRYQKIMPAVLALENSMQSINVATFDTWRKERQALFKLSKSSLKTHVSMIKKLYSQCNIQVG